MSLPADMCERRAFFSEDMRYRYWLSRDLDLCKPRAALGFLMNPSKAGFEQGDPTTTIMCNVAWRHDFGLYGAVNMRALIETNSTLLVGEDHETGPFNNAAIAMALDWVDEHDGRIIAAWGNAERIGEPRVSEVLEMLKGRTLLRFGVNKDGKSPRFPRAIPKDIKLEEWAV